jgi:uncharacterized protein (TIGR03067 family)
LAAPAPAALLEATFRAAVSFAADSAAAGGAGSAQALALTKGVLQTMFLSKLKLIAATGLSVAVVAGGLAYYGLAVEPSAKEDKKSDKPKEDKDAIQGTWKLHAHEESGRDISDSDRLKDATFTITGDKIVLEAAPGTLEIAYRLDPAAKPKAIDWDSVKGKSFKGVYSLDGDTLKICLPTDDCGDRPTEVGTKEGSNTRMLVLKRVAKDK